MDEDGGDLFAEHSTNENEQACFHGATGVEGVDDQSRGALCSSHFVDEGASLTHTDAGRR